MVSDFKDLLIWQKRCDPALSQSARERAPREGMEIAKQCYFLTRNFPKEEHREITSDF